MVGSQPGIDDAKPSDNSVLQVSEIKRKTTAPPRGTDVGEKII